MSVSMTAFKDFSITNKIRTIVMIVSSITLLMACGILGALEVINFRQTLVHELSILSKIIADRSTASLTFDDPKIAHETLDALKANNLLFQHIFSMMPEKFLPAIIAPDQIRILYRRTCNPRAPVLIQLLCMLFHRFYWKKNKSERFSSNPI